jgi:hypothetical protein
VLNHPRVLAITKRTAQLCGTQALLYGAGFELVTATSLAVARSLIGALRVKAVIVCLHSWTEEERESIAAELAAKHPEVSVVMRCPGCTGCDEANHTPGTLCDSLPLTQLITAMMPAAKP